MTSDQEAVCGTCGKEEDARCEHGHARRHVPRSDQWDPACIVDTHIFRDALELIAGGESLDAQGCARIARAALASTERSEATPPSEGGQS